MSQEGVSLEIVCKTDACRRRAGILTGDLLGVLDSWPEEKRAIGLKAIEEVEAEVVSLLLRNHCPINC